MIKLRLNLILLELFVFVCFSYCIYLDWHLLQVPFEDYSTDIPLIEEDESKGLFLDIFKFCISLILAYLACIFWDDL